MTDRSHAEKRADYRRRRYLNHAPLSTDATGTRRRIQALAAIGWSLAEQSRRLGWQASMANKLTGRSWVLLETAAKVRALYDELSMLPGDNQRARNEAARKGWPPPLAWCDDEIDDPNATPAVTVNGDDIDEIAVQRAMRGNDRTPLTRAERLEVVRRLTELGLSLREIADRLRVDMRQVNRDRADLAPSRVNRAS